MMKALSIVAQAVQPLTTLAGSLDPVTSQPASWAAETGKTLVCDVADVRLVAQSVDGHARYLVLRAGDAADPRPQDALAAGTTDDLGTAVMIAERLLSEFGLSATEWKVVR